VDQKEQVTLIVAALLHNMNFSAVSKQTVENVVNLAADVVAAINEKEKTCR
jgi:hypothetical protein